jgi:type IV pilus assembly protein PilM
MANHIVGLDVGLEQLRAVEVRNADKSRPIVTKVATVSLPDGAVRGGEVREVHTVSTAIRKLWSVGGFSAKDVVIGVGNQRVLARDLSVPKVTLGQIRESLPFQVQDMLPVPVAEALLDFYPISEGAGENGPVVNGLLIAAIKDAVLANVNSVRQAGLNPAHVDLLPFALTRVLARGAAERGSLVLVDIGASTTNVVVVTDGIPQFVRMIPAGGHDITNALASRLEISHEQAEQAKRARGLSSMPPNSESERRVAEIISESANEMIASLRNTVNYFSNSRPQAQIRALVLTGGGAELTGLPRALGEALRMQIIAADAFSTVDVARTATKSVAAEGRSMTVALGLALGSTV